MTEQFVVLSNVHTFYVHTEQTYDAADNDHLIMNSL